MKAVILVGGEGTRLRPLTCNEVKAMVPVLNRPFLEYTFLYLKSHKVEDIILTLGNLPQRIEGYFGDGNKLGVKLTYVVEESPLGTAGAVKNAEKYLRGSFFVFNGDIFTDIDLGAMFSFHKQRKAKATIALTPVEDPSLYGVVETDEKGRVLRFIEKPSREEAPTNLINAGIYILEPEVLKRVPRNTHFMFEYHLFPQLLEEGMPVYGYPSEAYWIDMGTPDKYLKLHWDLLSGKSLFFNKLDKGGQIGKQCLIHPTAKINKLVKIGDGCIIEAEAQILAPAVLGPGCKIQEGGIVKGSVLWQNVQVGKRVKLIDSIVGNDSLIGENCYISEGSVLGDRVEVVAGSKLPPNSTIWSGERYPGE